jgi:tetratricopeptide (TPR) repeat protein
MGLLLGTGTAFLRGRAVNYLASAYYDAYRQEWKVVRDQKPALFTVHPVKVYSILVLAWVTQDANQTCLSDFVRGVKLTNEGRYDDATQCFERVSFSKADPLYAVAFLYYGYCKQVTKDYRKALERYLMLEHLTGGRFPELFFNLASVYKELGDDQEAIIYRTKYDSVLNGKNKEHKVRRHE